MAGKAGMDGVRLQQAIAAYHQEKGQYPKTLMQLVQDGRIDGKLLHNDLDDNPNPGHISWRYTRPAEGAPGSTPILEEPYQITMGGSTQSSRSSSRWTGRARPARPARGRTPVGGRPKRRRGSQAVGIGAPDRARFLVLGSAGGRSSPGSW